MKRPAPLLLAAWTALLLASCASTPETPASEGAARTAQGAGEEETPKTTPEGAAPAGDVVETRDYAFPVPRAFRALRGPQTEAVWAQGGAAVAATGRIAADNAFLGSVVVTAIAAGAESVMNEAGCREAATATATAMRVELLSSSFTDTCRWSLQDGTNPNRGARAIVKAGKTSWMITCNFDARDPLAQAACDAVDQGWQAR